MVHQSGFDDIWWWLELSFKVKARHSGKQGRPSAILCVFDTGT